MHFHQTWLPFRAPPFSISDSSCFQAKIWHMLSKERRNLALGFHMCNAPCTWGGKKTTHPPTDIVEQFFRSLLHLVHIELEQRNYGKIQIACVAKSESISFCSQATSWKKKHFLPSSLLYSILPDSRTISWFLSTWSHSASIWAGLQFHPRFQFKISSAEFNKHHSFPENSVEDFILTCFYFQSPYLVNCLFANEQQLVGERGRWKCFDLLNQGFLFLITVLCRVDGF